MLTVAFGASTMSRTQVQLLYNRFKDGRDKVADDVGISFGSCQAIFTDVLGHETCGSEDCSKIAKFCSKTMSHGHRSGRRSRLAQKDQN